MPEHTPGPWSWTEYEHLLSCYRSGQISERQWQEHIRDGDFRRWIESQKREAAMPERVIMVRESEWREMREALEGCQSVLADLSRPRGAPDSIPSLYARSVEAEARARAALAKSEAVP